MKHERLAVRLAILLICMGGVAISCLIHYSDGDDAIFLSEIQARPAFSRFFVYLTKTMNGRLSATASLWVVFHFHLRVWRVLNGLMIAACVYFLSRIISLISKKKYSDLLTVIFAGAFFLIIGTGVIGYSCLWISGSVNYLWPFTTALIFMYPILLSVYREERVHPVLRAGSVLAGVYAALCQEQVALCLLAFCVLLFIKLRSENRKPDVWFLVSFLLIFVSVAVLIGAPFTTDRGDRELQWFPEYESLSLLQKGFILLQWMAHSFTHGLRFVMVFLWLGLAWHYTCPEQDAGAVKNAGALRLAEKDTGAVKNRVMSVIFLLFSLLSIFGAFFPKKLTDVGLDELDMNGVVEHAPRLADLGTMQLCALLFWLFALGFTLAVFVMRGIRRKEYRSIFLYLAGLSAAAVMIASPSIYASGERTLFVSGMLLMLLGTCEGIRRECILLAILQLAGSADIISDML